MNLLREYIRELNEKRAHRPKSKRTLYHIGPRPAEPKPMSRSYADTWRRHWLDQDVGSGVFFSPNPIDIAQYHGVRGDVYAYKVPEWVIAASGGIHRYDHGSEILISSDVWQEAGDEIEFLGKSMDEDELWSKIESLGSQPTRRTVGSRPGWMSDEEWERSQTLGSVQKDISGLRSTKHPENAIRMMTPEERVEVLRSFETIEVPGKKDLEIMDMIKSYIGESVLRGCVRELLVEWEPANEKNLMLDQGGMEKSDRENVVNYLKSLKLLETAVVSVVPGKEYEFPVIPFPAPGSQEEMEDLEGVILQYYNRVVPQGLQHPADVDMGGLFEAYLDHKGITYNTHYYSKLRRDLVPLIQELKDFYNRPRPPEVASALGIEFRSDPLKSAQTPSYPSGHTIQAYVVAHLLTDQFPDHASGLLGIAEIVSQSRIDRGVHFPTDIKFGRVIAKIIADNILAGSY